MKEIAKAYNHDEVEEKIYQNWEESGYFRPEINTAESSRLKVEGKESNKKPFVISMPPPNVTGKLHVGHSLFITLEDIMTRYHRLKGEPTLWLPGTDHAGIATQTVVDKMLQKKGINKREIGREKFVEEVWKWKEEYGNTITSQIRRMGASCDWSRERFTLDEGLNKAVNTAFVDFYNKGLIYQGLRVVNWCPKCHTAIADDEVEYKEQKGKLYWIKYGPFVLATTRPETKLGDTAVAVNPKDKRYTDMVGKKYMIPGVLGEFEIVVVADNAVDPAFGSGAVKVTPAHSFTDYEIAQRHNLPMKQIIDENGKMMANTGKYAGLKTAAAREEILIDMEAMGLIDHIDEYDNKLPVCYRCGGTIEPIPSKQWFVKMKPLAEKAIEAVKSGEIEILPERFDKVYFHWMDNIRDWCISRQLWWGHQIPVWYCDRTAKIISETPKKMGFAGDIVAQVFDSKTRTYRLRDHGFSVGDFVLFENSAKSEFFGRAKITEIKETIVDKIDLQDKKHWKTYDHVDQLIKAFKRHHPEKNVDVNTAVWIYTYEFEKLCLPIVSTEAPQNCPDCGSKLTQEPDVLDTWFSSGLWPFSSLGWPIQRKIGFNETLVDLIKSGKKTKTFRLWDHSLLLNEWIKLENTQTGEGFGYIQIKSVKETTFGEIDFNQDGHEKYQDKSDFVSTFQQYYPDREIIDSLSAWIYEFEYHKQSDLENYYPTSVMETGYDILFFWVARMIMMGLELTGKAPFKTVYLHGLVRDEQNRKMSKSLGNVLDPLDIIPKYGTDALRMALVVGSAPGQDIAIGESKIKGYRNFSNKIWNASRFVILRVTDGDLQSGTIGESKIIDLDIDESKLTDSDKEILKNHTAAIKSISNQLDKFRFSQAGEEIYEYFWHTLCDEYIEKSKTQLEDEKTKDNTKKILIKILTESLILLHPFVPFVTEAVWQEIRQIYPVLSVSIMVADWPKSK